MIVSSPQKLEQSMNECIIKQKKELREYIDENGEDDVFKEWEEDIKAINLETYIEELSKWKTVIEEEYKKLLTDQQKAFLIDPSLESLSIEKLETLKNQQYNYIIQRKKQLDSQILESSSNKRI